MNIIFTGGGTAGHVTPNIALIPYFLENGFGVHYIGMKDSIEELLISSLPAVTFHSIRSGKFRRYFSMKNFTDPFRVLAGIFDAKKIIRHVQPAVIFSKGGFVSVPVVLAGRSTKIPIVLHESDYTPGLANRIAIPRANKVLVAFEDTLPYTRGKGIWTGSPLRQELTQGNANIGREFLGFHGNRPILLCMGGSLGARAINEILREAIPQITTRFDIVHLCGKGNLDASFTGLSSYRQFEYLNEELPHVFKASDIAVSRAGANSIFEVLSLSLPTLLIPLPKASSRGDQLLNANYFFKKGYSPVLEEALLTPESLTKAIHHLYDNRSQYITNMNASPQKDGTKIIIHEIQKTIHSTQKNNK